MLPNPFYLIRIVLRDIGYYLYIAFYWPFWAIAWLLIIYAAINIICIPFGIYFFVYKGGRGL